MLESKTYRSNETNYSNLTTAMVHFEEGTEQMEVEKFNMENISLTFEKDDVYSIDICDQIVSKMNIIKTK